MMKLSTICLLVCVSATAVGAQKPQPVRVALTFGPPDSPFIDPLLKASANDLAGYLRGKKILQLVDPPDPGQVEIRLLTRSAKGTAGAVITSPAPNMAIAMPYEPTQLFATLTIGDFVQEFTATGKGSWKYAARRLAIQIDNWLKENVARIHAMSPG